MLDTVKADAASAQPGLSLDGMTIMTGGLDLCGVSDNSVGAIRRHRRACAAARGALFTRTRVDVVFEATAPNGSAG